MTVPLFRRLLGPEIDSLPRTLRAAHDGHDNQHWTGVAEVEASRNPAARLLCRMMRLPAPGSRVPVTVVFERHGDRERWRRDFAGRRYESTLSEQWGFMVERMGLAINIFRLSVVDRTLRLDLVGFRFLGVSLPAALRPRCSAREREEDGRYVFDVPISLWWFGRIIRYMGRLERRDD